MDNKKTKQPKLPMVLPSGKKEASFFNQVYEVARQVPVGRVTTYGAIAAFLGAKKSARIVGWAMNAAHLQMPPVPAQRIVNRNGILSGKAHFNPPSLMQQLLEKEGIEVKNDAVANFKGLFWDPSKELL